MSRSSMSGSSCFVGTATTEKSLDRGAPDADLDSYLVESGVLRVLDLDQASEGGDDHGGQSAPGEVLGALRQWEATCT